MEPSALAKTHTAIIHTVDLYVTVSQPLLNRAIAQLVEQEKGALLKAHAAIFYGRLLPLSLVRLRLALLYELNFSVRVRIAPICSD